MKFQSLAVIFAIIVIPISLVLSAYVQSNIDTITMQTKYDTKLSNATYDAVKAFQLNTINNQYSNVVDSKLRDVEAASTVFFTTLANNLGLGGYDESVLKTYVPALVYTLYDGYYIYAPYRNTENGNKLETGIKPYVYYTCHYVHGNIDIVVNYTLDNYITIYGTINGKYVTKSGYLINPSKTNANGTAYNGIAIGTETLSEKILLKSGNTYTAVNCNYKYYNGKKVYTRDGGKTWFTYVNETQIPAKEVPQGLQDSSAITYYKEAYEFTKWVNENLSTVVAKDAKAPGGATMEVFKNNDAKIFEIGDANDPEELGSNFNEHRREVMKNSIQTNLNAAIANYNKENANSTYNFKMPILTEPDWSNILDNVCVISFMQGIPIGSKYYNGYSIVANNKNKEIANIASIYFISGDGQYHDLRCSNITNSAVVGYSNIDFEKRSIPYLDASGEQQAVFYYPHDNTGDYSCIVSSGKLQDIPIKSLSASMKKAYYQASARIKYNLYKTNSY